MVASLTSFAQSEAPRNRAGHRQPTEDTKAKDKEEADAYYANADTADYGVRYRFKYLFNKQKNLTYEEDRVVLVTPAVTLDMSYEGIGERRWRTANPDGHGGDPSLAYHLTPSYYFYYPETQRSVNTYRIISEEFMLADFTCGNKWDISDDEKKIGDYNCKKATLEKDGRTWTAWYTTELPDRAAPRNFNGLPGVILDIADSDNEVRWSFNGLVNHIDGDTLFIKYPDRFSDIPVSDFPKVLGIFALAEGNNYIKGSGVLDKNPGTYPLKYRPSTGLAACVIDNPIER